MIVTHRTVIVETDTTMAAAIATACPEGTSVVARVDAAFAQPAGSGDDVTLALVIGPSIDLDAALTATERLRRDDPRTAVILICRRLDTSTLAAALRAGVHEVLSQHALADLAHAISHAHATRSRVKRADDVPVPRRARVTTVFAAKGGVGKTTVSTSLASSLAARGEKTALVDLDVAFGDVAVTLNLFPARDISDAAMVGDSLDLTTLESMLTVHASGLKVLAAPHEPGRSELITPESVTRVIELLAATYDHVLVDTPPALDERVLAAIDTSDLALLVATLDVPALKNLRAALDTLTLIGVSPERQRVLLNRADAEVGVSLADVPAALGRPVSAILPSSRDVPGAVNRGEVLVTANPRHPFSVAIARIATDLSRTDDIESPSISIPPVSGALLRDRLRVGPWRRAAATSTAGAA